MIKKMEPSKSEILYYFQNLDLEEAVSHRANSRIFEILGYLSLVDTSKLEQNDKEYLKKIEELSKVFLSELQVMVDYYKVKKHNQSDKKDES